MLHNVRQVNMYDIFKGHNLKVFDQEAPLMATPSSDCYMLQLAQLAHCGKLVVSNMKLFG